MMTSPPVNPQGFALECGKTNQCRKSRYGWSVTEIAVTDIAIRAALRSSLAHEHPGEDVTIVDELALTRAGARIDLAVINGALNGYEIKSDVDRLGRLPRQQCAYDRVFDYTTIVVGSKHHDAAVALVPEWWGVTEARAHGNSIELVVRRAAVFNSHTQMAAIAALLWRDELLAELEELRCLEGAASKTRAWLIDRLCACTSSEDVSRRVRERLKARVGWRSPRPRVRRPGCRAI